MPAPPVRTDLFPAGSTPVPPATGKAKFGEFYDYVVALLGADGTAIKAREALGIALPNHLLNPDGEVYQQAVAATADDNYMDDGWYALTQSGTILPSQVATPEDGYNFGLRITQSQVTAQRMGRAQIIEGRDAIKLRGKPVTFGGRMKMSATGNIRAAILAWTGTEDSVISDVVADWNSGTYTPGNFFNASDLTVVATSSSALTAATAGNVSVSGTVPSTAKNLVALYWTEAAAAQNVTLDAWGMRLVEASKLVDHVRRKFAEELELAKRYWEKSYEYGTAPGTATLVGCDFARRSGAETLTTFNSLFSVEKRAVPTITWYNPQTGTSGQVYNHTDPTNLAVTGNAAQQPVSTKKPGAPTHVVNGTLGNIILGHWVANCRL